MKNPDFGRFDGGGDYHLTDLTNFRSYCYTYQRKTNNYEIAMDDLSYSYSLS